MLLIVRKPQEIYPKPLSLAGVRPSMEGLTVCAAAFGSAAVETPPKKMRI